MKRYGLSSSRSAELEDYSLMREASIVHEHMVLSDHGFLGAKQSTGKATSLVEMVKSRDLNLT